ESFGRVTWKIVARLRASTPSSMRLSVAAGPAYWVLGPIQTRPPATAIRIANGNGPAVATLPDARSIRASLVSVAFDKAPSLVVGEYSTYAASAETAMSATGPKVQRLAMASCVGSDVLELVPAGLGS